MVHCIERSAHNMLVSRNMNVDRIGALHNSYLCTRCLRVRHLANGFNSRRRQTSLRASA